MFRMPIVPASRLSQIGVMPASFTGRLPRSTQKAVGTGIPRADHPFRVQAQLPDCRHMIPPALLFLSESVAISFPQTGIAIRNIHESELSFYSSR